MPLKSLRKQIAVAIAAGEAAIRVDSDEVEDAITTITEVCKKHKWQLRVWDHAVGTLWCTDKPVMQAPTSPSGPVPTGPAALLGAGAPASAPTISSVLSQFHREAPLPDPASEGDVLAQIMVIKNFHLAFGEGRGQTVATIQHLVSDKVGNHPDFNKLREALLARGIEPDADTGKFIIGVMPQEATLPPEIRPLFKVVTHELPDAEELTLILEGTMPESIKIPTEIRKKICHHALGLTRLQAEGVFSSAVVEFGDKKDFAELLVHYTWTQKSEILNAEGLVTLYQGNETFDDIVGHDGLKKLFRDLMTPDPDDPDNPELRAKGVALVGPPRTGKSATVKGLGNEMDRPLLVVDVGAWFGSHIGDTERSTRKGFQIIRAHAPAIAFIDEVEKAMPSARGYEGDGGVGRRMASQFMTNLQDIKEDIFWVFAANDVDSLHEAFLADDRVDCVVYVGMPDATQRAAGWKLYLKKFFPAEVNGKPYARAAATAFAGVVTEFKDASGSKGKPNVDYFVDRFQMSILCTHGKARETAVAALAVLNEQISQLVSEQPIDDSTWTVARIKSVCRLARKRQISLYEASKMMPRSQPKLEKVIARLQRWAAEEAIDARTGEAYVLPEDAPEAPATGVRAVGSKRRKTRTIHD